MSVEKVLFSLRVPFKESSSFTTTISCSAALDIATFNRFELSVKEHISSYHPRQTGMRRGEILGLQWANVNLNKRYVHVLKTKSGKERKIPMSDKLYNSLVEIPRHNENLFVNPTTKRVHINIKDVFPEFLKTAKINDFCFHDLRHTAATRMVESGIDLVVVKEILGHSDIKTTMRYAHPVPEVKLKAIQALNDY